ncbi:MAG: shikimate kinase [Candidatus Electrothrix sp. AR4]|nr:shikimate kinase [Candidatus Electrothrix sp. AR4]
MNKTVSCQEKEHLPSPIVLTGFRATGKTAVGKRLAHLAGYRFIDTDREICKSMGCSIAESVNRYGWQPFREHERTMLRKLSSWRKTVVATGGGAILHRDEWRKLRSNSFVVWLRTDIATTLFRLDRDEKTAEQRPSLGNQKADQDTAAEISALLTEREPLYQAGSNMIIDTKDKTPEELAEAVYMQSQEVRVSKC